MTVDDKYAPPADCSIRELFVRAAGQDTPWARAARLELLAERCLSLEAITEGVAEAREKIRRESPHFVVVRVYNSESRGNVRRLLKESGIEHGNLPFTPGSFGYASVKGTYESALDAWEAHQATQEKPVPKRKVRNRG